MKVDLVQVTAGTCHSGAVRSLQGFVTAECALETVDHDGTVPETVAGDLLLDSFNPYSTRITDVSNLDYSMLMGVRLLFESACFTL